MRKLIVALALTTAFSLLPLTASAHSQNRATFQTWKTDWIERVVAEQALTRPLLTEYIRMRARYPKQPPLSPRNSSSQPLSAIRSQKSGVEQWRPLIASHFAPEDVEKALRIVGCESRGDPEAKNPTSTAAGLWQFLKGTWNWVAETIGLPSYSSGAPYDPILATQAAAWLRYEGGGWSHWVCASR